MNTPELNKEISSEVNLSMKFEDKKIKLITTYEGKGAGAEVAVFVDSEYFLDMLAEAIPGTLDDAIIAMLKAAL